MEERKQIEIESVKIYSIFLNTYKVMISEDAAAWVSEYNFYEGDLSKINFSLDKRFKLCKKMRHEGVFLGLSNEISFPVNYPIKLINGDYLLNLGYKKNYE